LLEFITHILGKENGYSKTVAKERLQLVLIHDRASMSPAMIDSLRKELIEVISNYMEINETALEFNLCQDDKEVALVTNIPFLKMKRDYAAKR